MFSRVGVKNGVEYAGYVKLTANNPAAQTVMSSSPDAAQASLMQSYAPQQELAVSWMGSACMHDVCVCVCMYPCMHTHTHIHYAHTYMHVCIHTHTHTNTLRAHIHAQVCR